jgi:hypothetical protein
MEAEVKLHTVITIARPPRVAIGVPDGVPPAAWCNLLERVASRWGGLDSTIYFPSGRWTPGTIWDRLLTIFDPDEVLWYEPPSDPDGFLQRYAPSSCRQYRWMFHPEKGPLPIQGAAPMSLAARAWLAQPGGPPLSAIHNGAISGGQECLRLLLAREFGRMQEEEYTRMV